MASKKIHMFRQSAVIAGTPGDYYIDPSEKLMTKKSHWNAVEHDDYVEVILNLPAIGDSAYKDDDYCFIVNTDYLDVKKVDGEVKDGLTINYFPKIKDAENKKKNVVGVSTSTTN